MLILFNNIHFKLNVLNFKYFLIKYIDTFQSAT